MQTETMAWQIRVDLLAVLAATSQREKLQAWEKTVALEAEVEGWPLDGLAANKYYIQIVYIQWQKSSI